MLCHIPYHLYTHSIALIHTHTMPHTIPNIHTHTHYSTDTPHTHIISVIHHTHTLNMRAKRRRGRMWQPSLVAGKMNGYGCLTKHTAKWTKLPRTICFTQLMSRLVTAPLKLNASSPALLTSSACFAKSGLLCSLHRKLPCQLYLRKKSTQSNGFDFCHGEISVTVWRSKQVSG